jgi:hypothetical protein
MDRAAGKQQANHREYSPPHTSRAVSDPCTPANANHKEIEPEIAARAGSLTRELRALAPAAEVEGRAKSVGSNSNRERAEPCSRQRETKPGSGPKN